MNRDEFAARMRQTGEDAKARLDAELRASDHDLLICVVGLFVVLVVVPLVVLAADRLGW